MAVALKERPCSDRAPKGAFCFRSDEPFGLEHGGSLSRLQLAYETWGALRPAKDNVILLHTGLSASSHAHSTAANDNNGWWEAFIGPGRALDTDRFFVVCTNVLGGCFGSTGPSSLDFATGRPYGPDFPIITVFDMVQAQLRLLDAMGIERLHASVGSSLGGMQSLALSALAPDRVARTVSISATARSYPSSIAARYAQRRAVMADPHFAAGHYYDGPAPLDGMRVARAMGTLTYRSGPELNERFGRARQPGAPQLGTDFAVESYIEYQAEKFARTYDANSYLYISKAMDLFDLGDGFSSLEEGAARIQSDTLVIGVTTDILFPVWQQREAARLIQEGGAPTTYVEVGAPQGHDSFLILTDDIGGPVKRHLEKR